MSPFWRMEDPVMDNGKVVWPGMWKHQRDWWNLTSKFKALVAGYGGGKTFVGGKRVISGAIINSPAPSLAVSPTYDMARTTVVHTIKELLNHRNIPFRYNKNEKEFIFQYFKRLCTIIVRTGDDPDRLKGPNIGQAWIDEPFVQDKEVLNQILARVRHPEASLQEILLTGTPESLNWGYDICEGDDREKYDLEMVRATTYQNLALSDDYAEDMVRGYTEKAKRAFVDGEFVNMAEGTVYYAFSHDERNPERCNVKKLERPEGAKLSVGMDFNVDPMSAVIFWTKGDHIHVEAEIELRNSHTKGMCEWLDARYKDQITFIYPDASGAQRSTTSSYPGESDLSIIKDHGYRVKVNPGNPRISDRENVVNGRFEKGLLTISPDCKKLKQYFTQYTHENRGKDTGKKMSHLIDAFGYPVYHLFPLRRKTNTKRRVKHIA